jgi:hypothetical protein
VLLHNPYNEFLESLRLRLPLLDFLLKILDLLTDSTPFLNGLRQSRQFAILGDNHGIFSRGGHSLQEYSDSGLGLNLTERVGGVVRMDGIDCIDCLDDDYQLAQKVLYDLWYEYAEQIVERVIKVCGLTEDQAAVVRQIYLIPNGFAVEVV